MKNRVCLFFLSISFLFLFLSSCSKNSSEDTTVPSVTNSPNILLIIADDLGKDAINGYAEGAIKPTTPNIDAIRDNGLTFNNFWVYPTCSPTRSSIITGKYGYRTDVKTAGDELSPSETTLQKHISEQTSNTYASALIGKWHLSGNSSTVNPESFGIDYYAGLISGAVNNYYRWQLTENSVSSLNTDYTTEVFTDLSINWINSQTKPWFLWLAYNAPHTPFHTPPGNMHSQGILPDYIDGTEPMPYFMAATEAMDFQIGRLLDNITPEVRDNTIIIFLGDNGTPNQVAQSPYTSTTVKGSLFQGGINTPLFISGYGVSRSGFDDSLITSTDLFATISQISGSPTNEINDSKSFKSLFTNSNTGVRNYQYSEMILGPTESWTIANGNYKLKISSTGDEEFYNLNPDPYEANNLLNSSLPATESSIKIDLENAINAIRD